MVQRMCPTSVESYRQPFSSLVKHEVCPLDRGYRSRAHAWDHVLFLACQELAIDLGLKNPPPHLPRHPIPTPATTWCHLGESSGIRPHLSTRCLGADPSFLKPGCSLMNTSAGFDSSGKLYMVGIPATEHTRSREPCDVLFGW